MGRKRKDYDMRVWTGSLERITYNGSVRNLTTSSAQMKAQTYDYYKSSFSSREEFNQLWKTASELSRKVGVSGWGQKTNLFPITRILINDYFERKEQSLLSSYGADFEKSVSNAEWRTAYREEITRHRFQDMVDQYGKETVSIGSRTMTVNEYFEMFLKGKLSYEDWRLVVDVIKTIYGEKFIHSKEST